jgi:hypothetical protein
MEIASILFGALTIGIASILFGALTLRLELHVSLRDCFEQTCLKL